MTWERSQSTLQATAPWWLNARENLLKQISLMRLEKPLQERAKSSSPQDPKAFIPFWVLEDSTGITRIKERLCEKHDLHAWLSNQDISDHYVFVCVKCGAAYWVPVKAYVANLTRES